MLVSFIISDESQFYANISRNTIDRILSGDPALKRIVLKDNGGIKVVFVENILSLNMGASVKKRYDSWNQHYGINPDETYEEVDMDSVKSELDAIDS